MVKFSIIETCDLKHYVVQIAVGWDENDIEWNDITEPFDTYEQAIEWAKHLKADCQVVDNTYKKGE